MSVLEEKYSKKFEDATGEPTNRGAYYQEDATERERALVETKYKDTKLYFLVDPSEDRVTHAKFFAYGGKVSLAIGQTLCAMVKGLTVDEACSLQGEDVERQMRDLPEQTSVPESKLAAFASVPELLNGVREGYPAAKAVALASASVDKEDKPKKDAGELSITDQAWLILSEEEQISLLDVVLDEQVRPALIADGGNVKILKVTDGERVLIQYEGACGSCGSSIGGTLSFIEQALRKNVYNELIVVPNM
jgi:NifU-like protein